MSSLAQRYQSVIDRIEAASNQHGRNPADITLIVVSKNHPATLVRELAELGARDFGENRDQEASTKAVELEDLSGISWHFIGQLQTNKVKSVLNYASSVHSLDRESLLAELAKRCEGRAEELDVFIEVNLTDDPARGGVNPLELEAFAEKTLSAKGLRLAGLMGVASLEAKPERDFEKLANLSQKLQQLEKAAKGLSMGMSGDFEAAIGFGATHLRIGTAITGNRA